MVETTPAPHCDTCSSLLPHDTIANVACSLRATANERDAARAAMRHLADQRDFLHDLLNEVRDAAVDGMVPWESVRAALERSRSPR